MADSFARIIFKDRTKRIESAGQEELKGLGKPAEHGLPGAAAGIGVFQVHFQETCKQPETGRLMPEKVRCVLLLFEACECL